MWCCWYLMSAAWNAIIRSGCRFGLSFRTILRIQGTTSRNPCHKIVKTESFVRITVTTGSGLQVCRAAVRIALVARSPRFS